MQAESQHFQSLSHALHLQWWLSLLPRTVDSHVLTGCLSTLSLPSTVKNAFSEGLAEFARVLREGGAADSVIEHEAPTDYRPMADIEASADVIAALPCRDRISDAAIEECGYMGWLTATSRSA